MGGDDERNKPATEPQTDKGVPSPDEAELSLRKEFNAAIEYGKLKNESDRAVAARLFERLLETRRLLPIDLQNSSAMYDYIGVGVSAVDLTEQDPLQQMESLLKILEKTGKKIPDGERTTYIRFLVAVAGYAEKHPLTNRRAEAITDQLFPRFIKGDPEIVQLFPLKIGELDRRSASAGEKFGIADYYFHCETQNLTPASIHTLLIEMRKLPTTDLHRFEENVRDGSALMNLRERGEIDGWWTVRNLIHGQKPGIHQLLMAMLEFGKRNDEESIDRLEKLCTSIGGMKNMADYYPLLEIQRYLKTIPVKIAGGAVIREKAIDVLERLVRNTEVDYGEVPKIEDDEIYRLAGEVKGATGFNDKVGRISGVLEKMNGQLMSLYDHKSIGVSVRTIEFLGWLDHQCFRLLRSVPDKELELIYKEPWFHQILQFQELVHSSSAGFDRGGFEMFVSGLVKAEDPVRAFRQVATRTLRRIDGLSRSTEDMIDSLWSGNVTHILSGELNERYYAYVQPRRLWSETVKEKPKAFVCEDQDGVAFLLAPNGSKLTTEDWDGWAARRRNLLMRFRRLGGDSFGLALGGLSHGLVAKGIESHGYKNTFIGDDDRPEILVDGQDNGVFVRSIFLPADRIAVNKDGDYTLNQNCLRAVKEILEMVPKDRLGNEVEIKFANGKFVLGQDKIWFHNARLPTKGETADVTESEFGFGEKFDFTMSFPELVEFFKDRLQE